MLQTMGQTLNSNRQGRKKDYLKGKASLSPFAIGKNLWEQRELIKQFTKRQVIARYKGSYLGILWSFITPLFLLIVFTFVFSVIFQARWGVSSGNKIEFALILFCGLTVFNIFAECLNSSPNMILNNVNYVKKVVFPLEILPLVILGSALVHAGISLIILFAGVAVFMQTINWTMIFLPLVILPLMLMSLGLSWFIAALGVYLRDIGHLVGVITQALMFLTPIFYPISIIPEKYLIFYYLNPIGYVVEDMRRIIIWGQLPDWGWLMFGTALSGLVAYLGYFWFQKARGGFADVL